MLPRRERFPRALFPAALKNGRRISSAHFSVIFPQEGSGCAVVIPKKVARLSVTRHRLKRRILAALRTLPSPLPRALIVFPKLAAGSVSYQDIRAELATLLSNRH